ncbi:MAG: 50S ribosomal protein L4 [Planctomycetota bacterium]
MIELPIYDTNGKKVDALQIDEQSLGGQVRYALLKQAYVITHGNQRQGSARTKSRGDVEGSTRKLYKQKCTGNARAGAARTPIRKGGGVTFKKERTREDFRHALPKKMRRLANRNALLAKLVDNEVKCFAALDFKQPKTSDFAKMIGAVGVDRTCLVATDGKNRNAMLSARNVDGVDVCRIDQLSAFDLLNHRYLVVDKASLVAFLDESCFASANGDAGADAENKAAANASAKAKPAAKSDKPAKSPAKRSKSTKEVG